MSAASASIIIPVYNDPEGLSTSVQALTEQDDRDYEIVIVDNGSTDNTYEIATRLTKNKQVTAISEPSIKSSYAARNAGIEASNGDVIGFIDANMWCEPNYIKSIKNTCRNKGWKVFGCAVKIVNNGSFIGKYNQRTDLNIERCINKYGFSPTCSLVVEREVIENIGKFDPRLQSGGDREFGYRVRDGGYDLHYEPTISVYHPARTTLSEIVSKNFRIGRGFQQLHRYHEDQFDIRPLLSPRNFGPVLPKNFLRKVNTSDLSRTQEAYWYLLECSKKYARTMGRIAEVVKYQF